MLHLHTVEYGFAAVHFVTELRCINVANNMAAWLPMNLLKLIHPLPLCNTVLRIDTITKAFLVWLSLAYVAKLLMHTDAWHSIHSIIAAVGLRKCIFNMLPHCERGHTMRKKKGMQQQRKTEARTLQSQETMQVSPWPCGKVCSISMPLSNIAATTIPYMHHVRRGRQFVVFT